MLEDHTLRVKGTSYVEDNQRYPDAAIANARMKSTGKVWPHMRFKQPYRYEEVQKMKYRDELPFPHEKERIPETPAHVASRQILFPASHPFPDPVFSPETDPIPAPDPIPDPVWLPGYSIRLPRKKRRWRPSSGATSWINMPG